MPKTILAIGDTQSGSVYAPWDPDFPGATGAAKPNDCQRILWGYWQDFVAWAKGYAPFDAIIFGGDAIEGDQPKQGGRELTAISSVHQVENLMRMVGPLRDLTKKRFIIQGSNYHETGEKVELFGERWGAEQNSEDMLKSFPYLALDLEGKILCAFHEVSPTVGFYVTTSLERESMWSKINSEKVFGSQVDFNLRFHIHQATAVDHSSTRTQVCPGWQVQTSYERKRPRSMYRMVPEIGGLIIIVDGQSEDEPFRVKKMIFPLPFLPVYGLE